MKIAGFILLVAVGGACVVVIIALAWAAAMVFAKHNENKDDCDP